MLSSRMNMPIDKEGRVSFTTTLFALIRWFLQHNSPWLTFFVQNAGTTWRSTWERALRWTRPTSSWEPPSWRCQQSRPHLCDRRQLSHSLSYSTINHHQQDHNPPKQRNNKKRQKTKKQQTKTNNQVWPVTRAGKIDLLVPTDDTTGAGRHQHLKIYFPCLLFVSLIAVRSLYVGKLTVGKLYGGVLIYEIWKTTRWVFHRQAIWSKIAKQLLLPLYKVIPP